MKFLESSCLVNSQGFKGAMPFRIFIYLLNDKFTSIIFLILLWFKISFQKEKLECNSNWENDENFYYCITSFHLITIGALDIKIILIIESC